MFNIVVFNIVSKKSGRETKKRPTTSSWNKQSDTPEQSLLTKLPQVPQVPECLSAQVPQALWVLFEKKRSVALLEMDSLIVLSSF